MINKHKIFIYFSLIILVILLILFSFYKNTSKEDEYKWKEKQIAYWNLVTSKVKAENLIKIENQKDISLSYTPKVIFSSNNSNKEIAITIDDCYSGKNLSTIYELSKKYNINFTFFPLGVTIKNNANILKKLLDEGNEIELHGYSHKSVITLKTETGIYNDYNNEILAIKKYINNDFVFHYIRPPYGAGIFTYTKTKLGMYPLLSKVIKKIDTENQLTLDVAMWNADHYSSIKGKKISSKKNIIINYFKNNLSTKTIFLFHTTDVDASAIEEVIKYAISKKYKIVTLYELIKGENYKFYK